jgi:hypothetical protein
MELSFFYAAVLKWFEFVEAIRAGFYKKSLLDDTIFSQFREKNQMIRSILLFESSKLSPLKQHVFCLVLHK